MTRGASGCGWRRGRAPSPRSATGWGSSRLVGLPANLPAGSRLHVSIELDERNAPSVAACRVLDPRTAAAEGRAHDLEPLEVVAVGPPAVVPTDPAARARFRTLLATPR